MAEQNPDQQDPEALEEPGDGTDEAASAAGEPESEATSPEAESANPADADNVVEGVTEAAAEAETPPAEAGASEVDDMAAAALEAARSAIGELQGETEQAAGEAAPADAALVEDMMAKLEAEAAAAGEAGGRTIGQVPPRGGALEGMDLPALETGENGHQPEGIELLSDVDLQVKIELGRTVMLVEDVLRLNSGSIVELDKLAGDPVDVYVNDRRVARGEVLVLNDAFCVRISEVLAPVKEMGRP